MSILFLFRLDIVYVKRFLEKTYFMTYHRVLIYRSYLIIMERSRWQMKKYNHRFTKSFKQKKDWPLNTGDELMFSEKYKLVDVNSILIQTWYRLCETVSGKNIFYDLSPRWLLD
jgi:hypothetical protein